MQMSKVDKLYVAWQDPVGHRYFPVGCLRCVGTGGKGPYEFSYIKGAEEGAKYGFRPFLPFDDMEKTYRSTTLFPFFANRLLPHARKEYGEYTRSLGLATNEASPLEILARSGGRRATDSVEVFAPPHIQEMSNGGGRILDYYFLAHGLRHMRYCAQDLVAQSLKKGDSLFVMHDLQNPVDRRALALRTADYCCVGFLPRYLAEDVWELFGKNGEIEITLERLNSPPIPIQQRMLCKLRAKIEGEFKPCSSDVYRPLGEKSSVL
jgi:hypothetical protein